MGEKTCFAYFCLFVTQYFFFFFNTTQLPSDTKGNNLWMVLKKVTVSLPQRRDSEGTVWLYAAAEKQRHSSVLAPASRPAANDLEQALRAFIKASLITVMMNGIISTGESPTGKRFPQEL